MDIRSVGSTYPLSTSSQSILMYMWISASAGPYPPYLPVLSYPLTPSPYFGYFGLFSYTSGGLAHATNNNTCQFVITT